MPIPKNPSRKGSLRIKFDIEFPAMLTSNQKSWVKSMFGLQREMKKDGGHGANMAVDSHTPTRAVAASTHGEDSRPGRVIYIGSVPVRVDSI
uniref:DnaJ subfamily B member 5 n=1 Tax=Arundo donax TaxID=35708 RepID=A0A0A9CM80_ARUDO